ncbi:MAG TPA: hypothetical protein DCE44_03175 [Verrucomicrobiales bacterium]|nr:hypothetical protein [Verrucomicrobiales bacterium]
MASIHVRIVEVPALYDPYPLGVRREAQRDGAFSRPDGLSQKSAGESALHAPRQSGVAAHALPPHSKAAPRFMAETMELKSSRITSRSLCPGASLQSKRLPLHTPNADGEAPSPTPFPSHIGDRGQQSELERAMNP